MNIRENQKYILWLPSWYPCKLNPYDGDFIQRHAQAASDFIPIHVLYVIRDKERKITDDIEIVETQNCNLSETIIYYSSMNISVGVIDKICSVLKFKRISRKYLRGIFVRKDMPAEVHVHVAFKAGLIAIWLKKKFKLQYFVTEHWTGYNRKMTDNYFSMAWIIRIIIKMIFQNSKLVIPVSDDLGKNILSIVPSVNFKSIPNVVNEKLFYYEPTQKDVFRFIHNASLLKGQKNTSGLLNVLTKFSKKRIGWDCIIYGPFSFELSEFVKNAGLTEIVKFTGEIPYEEVAKIVRKSSAYVSFSNYENQPCSILEALCCGVPVIATNVGGIPEIINSSNGLMIDPGNEIQLLNALETMMNKVNDYDKTKIAEDAKNKFSYESVGKQLYSLYNS